jgi:hypothetical protein
MAFVRCNCVVKIQFFEKGDFVVSYYRLFRFYSKNTNTHSFYFFYTKTNTTMKKRYENNLLGIHVHSNIPPAESTNHGTARQRNQPPIRIRLPSTHITKHSITRLHQDRNSRHTHTTGKSKYIYRHICSSLLYLIYYVSSIP